MNKPFSQELYDNDDAAKEFVIAFFTKRFGFIVYVNPDPYGIDLIVENERGTFELEVEVKHAWKGKKFPFKSLHFAGRKIKFANNPSHVHFITLNHDWTYGLLTSGDTIKNSVVIRKDTIYTKNEKFIEVPIAKCTLLRLY